MPVLLSSRGAGESFYTSEIAMANRSARDATVELTYNAAFGGGSGMTTAFLGAGKQQIISDAIGYLRERGIPIPGSGNRAGTLRVRFMVFPRPRKRPCSVRTSTAVPGGRVGLAYSGLPPNSFLEDPRICSDSARTIRIAQTWRFRMSAPSKDSSRCGVTVYSGDASAPFSRRLPDVVLPPGGFQQIDGILVSNGLSLTNGYVRIERVSGTAPYYAYAVINDQLNSDGSFVPPVLENAMRGRTD